MSQAGAVFAIDGLLTQASAAHVLELGVNAIKGGTSEIDLAAVTQVDSSALAVIFSWMRTAKEQGTQVHFSHLPKNLFSLAEVYGVTDLLPLS